MLDENETSIICECLLIGVDKMCIIGSNWQWYGNMEDDSTGIEWTSWSYDIDILKQNNWMTYMLNWLKTIVPEFQSYLARIIPKKSSL